MLLTEDSDRTVTDIAGNLGIPKDMCTVGVESFQCKAKLFFLEGK